MSAPSQRDKILGVGLVVAATMAFATSDLLTKLVVGEINPFVIVWCRFVTFAAMTLPFLWRKPVVSLFQTQSLLMQSLRGLGALGSAILFTSSLMFIPLADAAAIGFVSPLFVVLLPALFLGERVTPAHALAALAGFCGVLLIVKPGSGQFGWTSLIPLVSALCWAVALICTRQMSTRESRRVTAAFTALFGLAGSSLILPFVWAMPPAHTLVPLLALAIIGTLGHVLTVAAYTYLPASRLAPLSYVQLLWVTGLSAMFLNAWPGLWSLIGMAMIVASGLYIATYRVKM